MSETDVSLIPGDSGTPVPKASMDGFELDPPEPVASKVPSVSLAKLLAAASGGARYPAGVKAVQAALVQRRFLPDGEAAAGMFDSGTMRGYRALQLHLGFTADRADGVPDKHSLTWLALRTGLYRMETES